MHKPGRARWTMAGLVALAGAVPDAAAAPTTSPPTVHPIYVSTDGAAFDKDAYAAFSAVAARLRFGSVPILDLPGPPPSTLPAQVQTGTALVKALSFDEAEKTLKAAAAEAVASGGAGLDGEGLSNLYLALAMAVDKADWRDPPDGGFPRAHPEAAAAYVQAALFSPDRKLLPRAFPPQAIARFAAALTELRARPRGTLVVRAPADALIAVDGRPAAPSPVELPALPYGDHLIRVEAPGRIPYAVQVPLAAARLEIDAPPFTHYALPDEQAVIQARQMTAAFALVVELKASAQPTLEIRLIEVAGGARRETTTVPARDTAALEAAIMRFDEMARQHDLVQRHGVPVGARHTVAVAPAALRTNPEKQDAFAANPSSWAEKRWPLLTAVGVAVGTALLLGLLVAVDDEPVR